MPTYNFRCDKCETITERVVAIKDVDGFRLGCPECGFELRKLFGAPGIAFKGSGWAGKRPAAPSEGDSNGKVD